MNYFYYRDNNFSLFTPEEGYNLGNMFRSLYNGYKNYKPTKLNGRTDKEQSFLELSRIAFAMHDMNLYLDVHPEDKMIQKLFNDYRVMFNNLQKDYENKYGPLNVYSDSMEKSPFPWVKQSWPWEGDTNV